MSNPFSIWGILSALNKVLLPSIHKAPDLTRLSRWQKAVVGWKLWVTYKRMDELQRQGRRPYTEQD